MGRPKKGSGCGKGGSPGPTSQKKITGVGSGDSPKEKQQPTAVARATPEQYYRDYDDMEIHFRQEHFLCEDKDCLSKKFVVFSTNSELKRHTAMEHGRRKSRSKRNATLLIPVSFQYRRGYDEQNHEGGGHGSLLDSPSSLISSVTQTSLAMGHTERFAQYFNKYPSSYR
ncbi:hypothetical protein SLE2022_141120 [Rubroshorea leprosula]